MGSIPVPTYNWLIFWGAGLTGSGLIKRVGATFGPISWVESSVGAADPRKLLIASVMACGLVASNLNLKPGECLRVRGEVSPDAKSFVLNLGKDSNNLCLHFNPRFNAHGDANTIVCNSKDGGAWGTEHREPAFPFQPGSVVEVCVTFDQADLTIKLPDGHEFKFPNRLNMEAINYMAADGDFKIKCVAFE